MSGIELVTTLKLQAVPKLVTPRTLAFTMGSPLLLAQILDTVSKIFVDITILLVDEDFGHGIRDLSQKQWEPHCKC